MVAKTLDGSADAAKDGEQKRQHQQRPAIVLRPHMTYVGQPSLQKWFDNA
jgi:hypothetical protein